MKRLLFTAFLTFSIAMLFAANGFEAKYSQPANGVHQVEFSLGSYQLSPVNLQGVTYTRIGFEGQVMTQVKGFAELPYLNASIMLDPVKNVTLEVIPGEYEEISLDHPLVPSRGVIYRNQDPNAVPYWINPRSVTDTWYPVRIAENTDPYIIRDIRGTSVYVYPFQYNAARQVLRVFKSVTVQLVENNTMTVNPLSKVSSGIVKEMDAVYKSVFINYGATNREDLTIGEFGDIHVIVTPRDEAAIQPYVNWKREKGFNVSVEVVPTNTTVNANVQAAYDNNNNILYVLLVGDWADLKCTTSGAGRPMDPQVGTVVGNDDFADIAVGRFSAGSPADVTTQVNKVINYEKLPFMGESWYSTAVGMASAEGAGIGDDSESDIQHETVIYNDKLDPFTYETFTQIFDPGATASMVTNAVNSGVSIINYTGHGSAQSWGTTGFSNTNVAALSNGYKLPFIFSVACDNGDFDQGTCFAESWLLKDGGGAIIFLGASISQPWQEPMRGQDYFNDILIGGYDYSAHPGQSGLATSEQRTTIGSIVFNGLTLMCVESGGGSDWETASTWNIFGDPSLQPRTATPLDLNLSNTSVMVGVPFTTIVSSSEGAVANAMVTLSQDGNYFTGVTDPSGSVTIEHTLNPGNAKLVVTGFNTETIYQDVNVVPPNGAYVTISSVDVSDADENGNGLLDYGETVYLTVGLSNVGSADATGVNAVISTSDEFASISDASENFGTIPAGETVTKTNGYQISASESIPDSRVILFNLEANGASGREVWSSSFFIPAHAPVLAMQPAYQIDDATGNNNGRIDPGETVLITITALNEGSADAYNISGILSCSSEFVTVNNSPLNYGDLIAGGNASQAFEVSIAETVPTGQAVSFVFDLQGDMDVSGQGEFVEYVGQIPVLLMDWDGNHSSPSIIEESLNSLEVGYDKMEAFPAERNLYSSIFVCLGTYSDNHVLTEEEGQILVDYLNQGGNVYMEGADTWYYDQQYNPTPVHPMFNITGVDDGGSDLSYLFGQPGSIVENLEYGFNGENSYIDHIQAVAPAQVMFMNDDPSFAAAVSYDAGTYRTIGSSFEMGGLLEDVSTKDELLIRILEFFNIQGTWTGVKDNAPAPSFAVSGYPNPFKSESNIRIDIPKDGTVVLDIVNINGQLIDRLFDAEVKAGSHEIKWNGTDQNGNNVAEGIYFYRVQTEEGLVTGKLIKM